MTTRLPHLTLAPQEAGHAGVRGSVAREQLRQQTLAASQQRGADEGDVLHPSIAIIQRHGDCVLLVSS
jgi:hypothetical protein